MNTTPKDEVKLIAKNAIEEYGFTKIRINSVEDTGLVSNSNGHPIHRWNISASGCWVNGSREKITLVVDYDFSVRVVHKSSLFHN